MNEFENVEFYFELRYQNNSGTRKETKNINRDGT